MNDSNAEYIKYQYHISDLNRIDYSMERVNKTNTKFTERH